MSYNILKKNVRFSGDSAGTIEGMVDTSTNQAISGSKEFEYLTGSNVLVTGSLVVDGDVSITDAITHVGDGDTKISFGSNPDSLFIQVGGSSFSFFDGGFVGGPKFTLATGANLFVPSSGKIGIGTPVNADPDHELVVTGTIGVAGQITCSLGITASEFHGDGSNLSGIEPTAANIVGTLSASQIDFNSPLQNNSERLDVSFASNRGIVDDSGVALDIGNLSSTTTYADTLVMPVSGSGATGNRKMTFGVLEANMNFHLTNSVGTLPNARLPSSISVTNLTASSTGQFTNINASGYVSASLHVSASEYATAGGTVIDAEGNFQGNNASFNEITASGVVSSSAEYLGDGSKLKKVKYITLDSRGLIFSGSTIRFWSPTGDVQAKFSTDDFRSNSTFIAPCSGTVRQVSITTYGAGTGQVKVAVGLFKNGDYDTAITEATGNLKPSGGHGGRQLPVLGTNFTNTFDMVSGSGTPLSPGSGNVFVSGTVPFAFDPNDSLHFGFKFRDGNNNCFANIQVLLELDDSNIP